MWQPTLEGNPLTILACKRINNSLLKGVKSFHFNLFSISGRLIHIKDLNLFNVWLNVSAIRISNAHWIKRLGRKRAIHCTTSPQPLFILLFFRINIIFTSVKDLKKKGRLFATRNTPYVNKLLTVFSGSSDHGYSITQSLTKQLPITCTDIQIQAGKYVLTS